MPTNNNRSEPAPAPADAKGQVENKIINNQIVNKADLTGINDTDLRFLRNTVYARHGRIFETPDLQRYFATRPWYRPRSEYSDSDLTANDRANANTIKAAEGGGSSATADAGAIQKDVLNTLNGWIDAMRQHDLAAYVPYYAGSLDTYYKRSNVTRNDVRADKARAFSRYATLDIQISNLQIKPDETSEHVAVTYTKAYDFAEADGHHFSGTARSAVWLEKVGNRWMITSEKDL